MVGHWPRACWQLRDRTAQEVLCRVYYGLRCRSWWPSCAAGRGFVLLLGISDRVNSSIYNLDGHVGFLQRLGPMRNSEHCAVEEEFAEDLQHQILILLVQIACGLVHNNDSRVEGIVADAGSCNAHQLFLAVRQAKSRHLSTKRILLIQETQQLKSVQEHYQSLFVEWHFSVLIVRVRAKVVSNGAVEFKIVLGNHGKHRS